MDIFKNANVSVETYPTRRSDRPIDTVSDVTISNIALREHAEREQERINEAHRENIEKERQNKELQESIVKKSLFESQLEYKIGKLSSEGRDLVFKDMVFEVFSNALLLDDYFVKEHADELKLAVDDFIDNNGGYKMLEEACGKHDIPLLKAMKKSCDKIVMEVCKKKIEEAKECKETDGIGFIIDDEDSEKLDYAKKDLSLADVSDLVKNKVLTVVKDEKKQEENNKEILTEIEDELAEDENVTDEKSLNEAFHKVIIQQSPIEEATLFNSLLRNSLNEMIVENVAVSTGHYLDDLDDRDGDDIVDTSMDDLDKIDQDDHGDLRDINDDFDDNYDDEINPEISLNEHGFIDQGYNANPIDIDDDEEFRPIEEAEDVLEGICLDTVKEYHFSDKENSINMDLVMAEAITKYTLMETFYTLGLKDYSNEDIRKMSNEYLNESFTPSTEPLFEGLGSWIKGLKDKSGDKRVAELRRVRANLNNTLAGLTLKDFKYFDNWIKNGEPHFIKQLEGYKKKDPDRASEYETHIKWLKNTYTPALKKRKAQLEREAAKKSVKESFDEIFDSITESSITVSINNIPKMTQMKPANDEQISSAETQLNTKFSQEYKSYLKTYGCVSGKGICLTGLVTDVFKNVVSATINARQINHNIPTSMYVIELSGPGNIVILQDETGTVYQCMPQGVPHMIHASLSEFIEQRIKPSVK